MSVNCLLFIYQLTTNFLAKYQLTTICLANCQLTTNPISTLGVEILFKRKIITIEEKHVNVVAGMSQPMTANQKCYFRNHVK